jgi:hypothetical protein
VTRIEFANGDVLDTSNTVTEVLDRMHEALRPVTDYHGLPLSSGERRSGPSPGRSDPSELLPRLDSRERLLRRGQPPSVRPRAKQPKR